MADQRQPPTCVLICDDREGAGRELAQTFCRLLPSIAPVDAHLVSNGFALVDAFEAMPVTLVLIGIHAGSTTGIDSVNLLLGIHPTAKTVVYGSVRDVDLLAAAYARGTGGLLVWEPTGTPTIVQQDRAALALPVLGLAPGSHPVSRRPAAHRTRGNGA